MIVEIERIKKTRNYLIEGIQEVSADMLNKVPEGFNNNMVWNLAHLIAAQQGICYIRSGRDIVVEEKYVAPYRPGTKPERYVDEDEIVEIKKVLLSSIDKLNEDYERKIFTNYPTWATRYGVEITNIDDAIQFLMFHEGLHCGAIMAIKKLVTS